MAKAPGQGGGGGKTWSGRMELSPRMAQLAHGRASHHDYSRNGHAEGEKRHVAKLMARRNAAASGPRRCGNRAADLGVDPAASGVDFGDPVK